MKLSIIIPVYDVEAYLCKCVDSVLNQDYEDYEVILVDDGSSDRCPQICDDYAARYSNIRVVHQENRGLSEARNSGIKIAQGEFIQFVDSDDYLEPNVLKSLMAQVEREKLDVLRFNYQNVNEKGDAFSPYKDAKRDMDFSDVITDGETFLNERLGPACYVCHFIIHHELVGEFTSGIYFEDTDWTPRMLIRAKRASATERIVYNYLWRVGSITLPNDSLKRKKVLTDKLRLISGFKEQQKLVKNRSWFIWQTSEMTISILNLLASYPIAERAKYIRQLQALNIFPLPTHRANGNMIYKIWLANISPVLYCWVMRFWNGR